MLHYMQSTVRNVLFCNFFSLHPTECIIEFPILPKKLGLLALQVVSCLACHLAVLLTLKVYYMPIIEIHNFPALHLSLAPMQDWDRVS